jgi:hypothetical protein
MGQLESLRELNTEEPNNKIKNKKSMPLLFILIGLLVNLEIWRHYTLNLFGKLHNLVLAHFTLFRACDTLACIL